MSAVRERWRVVVAATPCQPAPRVVTTAIRRPPERIDCRECHRNMPKLGGARGLCGACYQRDRQKRIRRQCADEVWEQSLSHFDHSEGL